MSDLHNCHICSRYQGKWWYVQNVTWLLQMVWYYLFLLKRASDVTCIFNSNIVSANTIHKHWTNTMFFLATLLQKTMACVKLFKYPSHGNLHSSLVGMDPLTSELNPSAQRCLTKLFTGDFASWTIHFVNIYALKTNKYTNSFIQLINYRISPSLMRTRI
jgi:hypothetical protein